MQFFILLNHKLSDDQRADAIKSFETSEFVEMPLKISEIWSNIPPDAEKLDEILEPVKAWLSGQALAGDTVLVQGDFGAVYSMVDFAFSNGLVPVYATTSRDAVERKKEDGSIETVRVFRHRTFRKYSNNIEE